MTKEVFILIQLWMSCVVFCGGLYIGSASKRNCVDRDLILRLRTRASIRRNIQSRKSVQEGKPDRISDLLEEAAKELERLSK